MEHREIRDLLPAYLDQELGVSDALAVELHLAGCPDCQRDYAEQRTVSRRIRNGARYFDAPAHLAGRINAALPPVRPRAARPRYWTIGWLKAGASMAALLALGWSIGLYLALRPAGDRLTDEVIASHVRSLQVDHLSDVVSSDQHTVKPWFNGKLNFAPPVVDLQSQGFALAGGRLDYLNGRSVAVLIYRHNQHPINLYMWPSTGKDAGPQVQVRQGYHVVSWTADGMAYWTVSDLAENELKNFAQIVRTTVRQG